MIGLLLPLHLNLGAGGGPPPVVSHVVVRGQATVHPLVATSEVDVIPNPEGEASVHPLTTTGTTKVIQ